MKPKLVVPIILLLCACGPISRVPALATASATPRVETTMVPPTPATTPTYWVETTIGAPLPTSTPPYYSTLTQTPTGHFPALIVTALEEHCAYGPSPAYIHATHIHAGDRGAVIARFARSNWLLVQFDHLDYACWISPSVGEISGDVAGLPYAEPDLPPARAEYPAPVNISASREGDQVTISWEPVWRLAEDDRGYFAEFFLCQGGALVWWTAWLPDQNATDITVTDQAGCDTPSSGNLYSVEIRGYSPPAAIPWPSP